MHVERRRAGVAGRLGRSRGANPFELHPAGEPAAGVDRLPVARPVRVLSHGRGLSARLRPLRGPEPRPGRTDRTRQRLAVVQRRRPSGREAGPAPHPRAPGRTARRRDGELLRTGCGGGHAREAAASLDDGAPARCGRLGDDARRRDRKVASSPGDGTAANRPRTTNAASRASTPRPSCRTWCSCPASATPARACGWAMAAATSTAGSRGIRT